MGYMSKRKNLYPFKIYRTTRMMHCKPPVGKGAIKKNKKWKFGITDKLCWLIIYPFQISLLMIACLSPRHRSNGKSRNFYHNADCARRRRGAIFLLAASRFFSLCRLQKNKIAKKKSKGRSDPIDRDASLSRHAPWLCPAGHLFCAVDGKYCHCARDYCCFCAIWN